MSDHCTRPPAGWYCTRSAGHEGPCAAHPDPPPASLEELPYRFMSMGDAVKPMLFSFETKGEEALEKRSIALPQGGTLEVILKPELLVRVRKQFGLSADAPVLDDHVRMFVWAAVKGGLDKVDDGSKNVK